MSQTIDAYEDATAIWSDVDRLRDELAEVIKKNPQASAKLIEQIQQVRSHLADACRVLEELETP